MLVRRHKIRLYIKRGEYGRTIFFSKESFHGAVVFCGVRREGVIERHKGNIGGENDHVGKKKGLVGRMRVRCCC